MEIDRLKEFIKLGEHLNYTQASRDLYIAQSTLSDHIAAAEKELGIALVERRGGEIDLTEAGWILFDRAQRIVSLYDKAVNECREADRASATLRVTDLISAIGFAGALDAAAGRLKARNPADACQFSFVNVGNQDLQSLLLDDKIDVGLVSTCEDELPELDEGFASFFIQRVPLKLYMSPDNPLAVRPSLVPADLNGMRVLSSNQPQFRSDRRSLEAELERYGVSVEFKMYRAKSQFDRLPVDPDVVLFISPHYAGLYRSIWGNCGDDLVQKDVEGLDLALDYHGVYRVDGPRAVRALAAEMGQEARG